MKKYHILKEDEFVRYEHDSENNILIISRFGYPPIERLKQSLEKSLEYFNEYSCNKAISNLQQVKGTWTAANDWIAKDWFPRAIKAGLTYVAYVYPPDIFGKFALDDLVKRADNYTLQIFDDFEKAYNWIAAQK